MKSGLRFLTVLLLLSGTVSAQWTCRSKVSAFLKPVYKESKLEWAGETTLGAGIMNDRNMFNGIQFLALSYNYKNHDFYIDGGLKHWTLLQDGMTFNNTRPGMREFSWSYRKSNFEITSGLQAMSLGDHFLVNERGLGIQTKGSTALWDWQINAATVNRDFARMGGFCSVRYIYDYPGRDFLDIADGLGESNFVGATLVRDFSRKKTDRKNEDTTDEFVAVEDEFEAVDSEFQSTDDEFQSADDEFQSSDNAFGVVQEQSKGKSLLTLSKLGAVAYHEFGSWYDVGKTFTGLFAVMDLPLKWKLEPEVLYVNGDGQAIYYYIQLRRTHTWKGNGSRTQFSAKYIAASALNSGNIPGPSFSNMFLGEVMRLDAGDQPLAVAALKHNFPKYRLHFKLQAVQELVENPRTEYNLAIGKTFFKGLKITAMGSYFDTQTPDTPNYMARIEMRFTF